MSFLGLWPTGAIQRAQLAWRSEKSRLPDDVSNEELGGKFRCAAPEKYNYKFIQYGRIRVAERRSGARALDLANLILSRKVRKTRSPVLYGRAL
jgi:hypothetical protein